MTLSYILVIHPSGLEQAISLPAGIVRVGSAPDNDLVLTGPSIAPHHAIIRCDEEGDLLISVGGGDARSAAAALEVELPRAFATAMLARIGDYVLRYQPAARPSRNQSQTDQWMCAPADEQTTLLGNLLDQRIVWLEDATEQAKPHEAITVEMQVLHGVTLGE